ncbi:lysosomal amino acid transporter 1 homolog isoform X4 [Neopsephotus bourkii]|uniref:lysosomal amino acid transporter 1 homolog isoform X4 n=1 Tax=Neopsephotus bourkii TaxID=309878 RepID=UPI002AA59207|nr:lysosomal amino acid transporter 1 homolog isoform X4 [Neopsephotus bourkii]
MQRSFSQRIISIGKQICGFAWGRKGGRNKLVTSNRGPGMMASQLNTHAFNISSIEDRRLCINGTPWIWHLLEECVENAWEYWSVVIGLISIVCFLFAALPQVYVAYQNGRVDQALSLGFLLGWIAGDITNFIGCYLTNQLPIQNSLGMIEMSGFICGYVSCVFYLGSRFPQLYKNFRRRSTEGTSYLLFALAMMGNCTYGLSLVLRMPAAKAFQALYFLHHLPWLIGSFGVLFLDIFVTLQFILYRQQKERESGLVTLEVEPLLVNEETA